MDEVLDYLGYTGEVLRVYVNDNITKNIVRAFDHLVPNDGCRPAGAAANARSIADKCFGVNESRLASTRLHGGFYVGRVQTPTLGLVVARDEAIDNHVTRKFYELTATGGCPDADSQPTFKFKPGKDMLAGEKHVFDAAPLETIKAKMDGSDATFTTVISEKTENPPLPYNLTVLLSDMSERFGFTAAKTQQITQDLRDKYKAITFPDVDWEAWRAINPDVIGWISIPGTPVDYPIVQAPADDPTYYLKHDVYRKPNFMGCPYLDADCAEGGLFGSTNAVVFGHNLGFGDTSMFNAVASYTDASFAREHCRVLLQTPDERREFEVQAADCIGGWEAQKRTRFESEADFSQWYADRLVESDMRLTDEAVASPIVTLCTCSYNRWADNERTVVYAAPIGAEKSASENPQVDGAL